MFLKSLKIEENKAIVREIIFLKGINLIVDETKTASKQESGNSVGKTTVIRLIDFCLGGDGKNIYSDNEFKDRTNVEVEKYLKDNDVIITLTLTDDLDNEQSNEVAIRRNFLSRVKKIQEINGTPYNNSEFPKKLKEILFKSSEGKPTLRQIVAKNVRDEKNRLANAVKVLNAYTSQQEYEALYYFWLGVNIDNAARKQKLLSLKKIETDLQAKLKKETNFSQIEQSLIVVNRSIEELSLIKSTLNLNENFENDLNELTEIKSKISALSSKISRLEMRRALINESKEDLESQVSNINSEFVRQIYNEAKSLIPEVHKSFEETLHFHNQMIENKVKFISEELPELNKKIALLRNELNSQIYKEKSISSKISSSKNIGNLEEIIIELNGMYQRRGDLLALEKLWLNSNKNVASIDEELNEINSGIQTLDDKINQRIAKFNLFFSEISYKLYGEKFILSLADNPKGHELVISSAISGNLGTGKKKVQIVAFDLAYIQFADSLEIPCLHFILHDQIENIHDNQLSSLLTEIVSEVNCQLVLPVLRDKLPDDIIIGDFEILSLSQDEKLFRI